MAHEETTGVSLEAILKDHIARHGPLTIAQYMELALSHPEHGYYMRKDPLGVQGDFITAPEISQIFGEVIGAWLAAQWQAMGKPKAALIELGPGRGTLMADILRATKQIPGFQQALSVHLVEMSPALKARQWQKLAGQHHELQWHTSLDELPDKPWLLVANEFFDALPVRQFLRREDQWQERMVDVAEGKLQFTAAKPQDSKMKKWLDRIAQSAPHNDDIIEYCEAALSIAGAIGEQVKTHGGVGLIVDYGYTQGTRGDTLQAVRDHHYHDPLLEPGIADLTCHVDFAALREAATASGATAYGPVIQGIFLKNLGAVHRAVMLSQWANPEQKTSIMSGIERIVSIEQMGDLFKALCIAAPSHPKPEGFEC
jgi:NADH dehydrogenase [ubiquinone] 1 alpha subcomplex assembly factor 7